MTLVHELHELFETPYDEYAKFDIALGPFLTQFYHVFKLYSRQRVI